MTSTDREPRTRTLLRGRIEYNEGRSSLDCLIRDISSTGARLELSDLVTVPLSFRLFVPKHDRRYQATLRWRRDGQVGIEFAHQHHGDADGEQDPDKVIARLEAEVAKLRGLVEAIRADPSKARLLLDQAA